MIKIVVKYLLSFSAMCFIGILLMDYVLLPGYVGYNKEHYLPDIRGKYLYKGKKILNDKGFKDAELMAGYKVDKAVLSISGENIRGINTQGAIAIQKSHHSSLPVENEITEKDVYRVMEMARALSLPPDRDIMHVLPQEYVLDTMECCINFL